MNNIKNLKLKMLQENVKEPMRSTIGSAGNDIFMAERVVIPAGKTIEVGLPFTFTGDIHQDVMVRVFVRSSFGIKKKVRIIVDGKKNALGLTLELTKEKHVITLLNDSDNDLVIEKDEHFAQFILSTKNPKEEKQTIETLTKEELNDVVPTKGHMEEVRPNVFDYILDEEITLAPNEQITLPTGIRTVIEDGRWTAIVPHESVQDVVMLANACAIIDTDYAYNPSTKGNCFLGIVNLKNEEVVLPVGTKLTRWHTEKYFTLEDEIKTDKIRTGGIGNTTEKK